LVTRLIMDVTGFCRVDVVVILPNRAPFLFAGAIPEFP
jgi:hypothetical protein